MYLVARTSSIEARNFYKNYQKCSCCQDFAQVPNSVYSTYVRQTQWELTLYQIIYNPT
jgi:hypothetical protein